MLQPQLAAQSVSNLTAQFTGCKAVVKFTLTSGTAVDLTLKYTGDSGKTWLPCTTVSGDITGQTTGNKQIVWDCYADGIRWGMVEFMVEVPQVGCGSNATITDIDGNIYHIVTIGTQTWMMENLKTTKYNDGTAIPNVTNNTTWAGLTTGAYCYYNNDATTYKEKYGCLYNWYAVNTGKLAPKGWHVPADAEWTILENYLIANGYNYDGSTTGNYIAKSLASTTGWDTSTNTGAIGNDLTKNNRSCFSALPGGFCTRGSGFSNAGGDGYWWSSDQSNAGDAWGRHLGYASGFSNRISLYKPMGFSVRCVRN